MINAYRQGMRSAAYDFGWCSKQFRRGNRNYSCAECDYVEGGKQEDLALFKEWHRGYSDYFKKQNAKPRKTQIPLPEFY